MPAIRLLPLLLLVLGIGVFMIQNPSAVPLVFLGSAPFQVPLAVSMLAASVLGALLALVLGLLWSLGGQGPSPRQTRLIAELRARLRELEAKRYAQPDSDRDEGWQWAQTEQASSRRTYRAPEAESSAQVYRSSDGTYRSGPRDSDDEDAVYREVKVEPVPPEDDFDDVDDFDDFDDFDDIDDRTYSRSRRR